MMDAGSVRRRCPDARSIADLSQCVRPPAGAEAAAVRAHLDDLTKPPGSLGRLEELAVRVAVVLGDPPPLLTPRTVFVLAGDHGVTARGVSAYPAEVTPQMCVNIARGTAAVSVMARTVGAGVVVADLGVAVPLLDPAVVDLNVVRGTRDLSAEAALTEDDVERAVLAGASLVRRYGPEGRIAVVGEMGIGNTTSAAALAVALTGCDVEVAVGRGTGVVGEALARKRAAVSAGLRRIPPGSTVRRMLSEVGGAEIAGMAGAILGAAAAGQIVILDGYISSVAGLAALRLAPALAPYLVASHRSAEPGHGKVLEALGLQPLLDLELRLGEGSGAVLAIPLLDAAAALLRDMATFSSAGVSGPVAPVAG